MHRFQKPTVIYREMQYSSKCQQSPKPSNTSRGIHCCSSDIYVGLECEVKVQVKNEHWLNQRLGQREVNTPTGH